MLSIKYSICILLIGSSLFAQKNITDKFLFRSQTYMGKTIPYRLFIPENYHPEISYPLILCLHGSGEAGTDNFRQITANKLAVSWAEDTNQVKNPCFVVAPQCPANDSWVYDIEIKHGIIAPPLLTVVNILDSLEQEFNIDTNRLYVTGLSMGGYGTWDIITRYPDKFAAAVPMSGGGDTSSISRIDHIPIWNFHGRIDPSVSVEQSRMMFNKFEQIGRNAIYTHCNKNDCNQLADSTLSRLIDEGTDLLYTEYQQGAHVIWDQAYDTQLLHDWVFKQHKIADAVWFTNFKNHNEVSGIQELTWDSKFSGGKVNILYNPDYGHTWQSLAENYNNSGSFKWNTDSSQDSYFGRLKIIIRDSSNFLCSHTSSSYFTLNNSVNGKPLIKILNEELNMRAYVFEPEYTLRFLAGDPDNDSLIINLFYSPDGGKSIIFFDSFSVQPDSMPITRSVHLDLLQNSEMAEIIAMISDGTSTYSDNVFYFWKNTPREPVPSYYIQPVSKLFNVPFTVNLIDTLSTAKNLLLTFDDTTSLTQKYFSVYDLIANHNLIDHKEFYSNNESPVFEGLSFITNDVYTKLDLTRSGWNSGVSKKLNFSAAPLLTQAYPVNNGYGKPDDYKIVFYGSNVGNSIADTLYPPNPSNTFPSVPVNFNVFSLASGKQIDAVYRKTGTITTTHSIFLKEDIAGKNKHTWKISIVDNDATRIIPEGDTLYIYTYKGLSIYDSLRISTLTTLRDKQFIQEYKLLQNYPNPFNPATTIEYNLPFKSQVQISIYNILGQLVFKLVDNEEPAGVQKKIWNAQNFSSGVYILQMKAEAINGRGKIISSRKLILLK